MNTLINEIKNANNLYKIKHAPRIKYKYQTMRDRDNPFRPDGDLAKEAIEDAKKYKFKSVFEQQQNNSLNETRISYNNNNNNTSTNISINQSNFNDSLINNLFYNMFLNNNNNNGFKQQAPTLAFKTNDKGKFLTLGRSKAKKTITKADISMPTNLRVFQHVGLKMHCNAWKYAGIECMHCINPLRLQKTTITSTPKVATNTSPAKLNENNNISSNNNKTETTTTTTPKDKSKNKKSGGGDAKPKCGCSSCSIS
jgi:hypothetical protein